MIFVFWTAWSSCSCNAGEILENILWGETVSTNNHLAMLSGAVSSDGSVAGACTNWTNGRTFCISACLDLQEQILTVQDSISHSLGATGSLKNDYCIVFIKATFRLEVHLLHCTAALLFWTSAAFKWGLYIWLSGRNGFLISSFWWFSIFRISFRAWIF